MAMGVEERVGTRKPHFFKVLLGDFSHQLRIPPSFIKHISKEASDKAILKGPSGDQWRVNISKGNCNDVYFRAGWKVFAKDHHLHEHDFLVFRYNGGMHFSVLIFDKTACERDDAFRTKNSEGSAYEGSGRRDVTEEIKNDHSEKSKKRSRVHFELGQHVPSAQNINTKGKREFHQTTPRVKGKVCHSPYSFTSEFPFFIKCIYKSCIKKPCVMIIPKSFHCYLPKDKNKFIIQVPNGKNWELFVFRQTKFYFCRGWHAFRKGNNLKEGDMCIFEMLDASTFRVYFYPDMGHKKVRGKMHVIKEIEKNFGGCHTQKSKKRRSVEVESGQYEPSASKVETKRKQKFHHQTPRVKGRACHSPDSFSSKFPCFAKCITKTNVMKPCIMHIPKNFHGYLPKRRKKFILRDPNGKNWEVFISSLGEGRIHFARGLIAFCRENNPQEGDVFIFELQDISTFQVHIYRSGS